MISKMGKRDMSMRMAVGGVTVVVVLSVLTVIYFNSNNNYISVVVPSNQQQLQKKEKSTTITTRDFSLLVRVLVADLPRSLNYGLLDLYWSLPSPDSRIPTDPDSPFRNTNTTRSTTTGTPPPYPTNPVISQYSAEYWLLDDILTPHHLRSPSSVAVRVNHPSDPYDVVLVPFFATISAELELGWGRNKGSFAKKDEVNQDYQRQKEVMDRITSSQAWKRSGGRDHVFIITDPVAMWHVKKQIAPAILLVVDFGGWYKLDSKSSSSSSSHDDGDDDAHIKIHHTQVSLLKDVIVPYTHLLPRLHLSENTHRPVLLYFKGAKHRHRGGLVREKLWDMLVNEPDVIMEEGFPNATGREQSIKGMRTSEFCLHPAGDTPTSCRLFDAILSLCIPVIVSDNIELPFEGLVDYSDFSVFASVGNALQPGWLVHHLRGFSKERKDKLRENMAGVQSVFEYDNGSPGGIGPVHPDGAVNYIWRKIHEKLPMIREAIIRKKRIPEGVSVPLRCHCT